MALETPCAALHLAASLAVRPRAVLRRAVALVAELGQVGLGTSVVAPHRDDERFADPGWLTDPVRRRAMQAYLATTGALSGLLDDARLPDADEARLRVLLAAVADLTCPAGTLPALSRPGDDDRATGPVDATTTGPDPVRGTRSGTGSAAGTATGPDRPTGTGPAAATIDRDRDLRTGEGLRTGPAPTAGNRPPADRTGRDGTGEDRSGTPRTGRYRADGSPGADSTRRPGSRRTGGPNGSAASASSLPSIERHPDAPAVPPVPAGPAGPADATAVLGRDAAATPGAVVLRTPMFELIQYLPRTDRVRDVPVLVVGPLVHRFWLADLAPGHSLVEHLVAAGQQVFALSWPFPADDAGDRDLDTYAAAVLDAVEAATRIARCPRVVLLGVRSGGLLCAAVQAHLAATGRADRVAAAVYLATALDQHAALPGFRLDPGPSRNGAGGTALLDAETAVRSWTWRRGGEQVRPYAVDPAAADRLPPGPARRALRRWAADLLAVPVALHDDLLALATGDPERPATDVLGTPVAPGLLTCDAYLVTPADDPAQPWTAGLRTARLLSGTCRLVRARGDQAGALVPTTETAGFRAGDVPGGGDGGDDAGEAWEAAGAHATGSWWPDLTEWLADRTGALREAPPELGGRRMHPVHPAPGTYVT